MSWPRLNPGCHVPDSLQEITCIGQEDPADTKEIGPQQIGEIWRLTEQLYRSGAHPAIQLDRKSVV